MRKKVIFEKFPEAKKLINQNPNLIFALKNKNFNNPVTFLNESGDKLKL
jgi:hypothetical protein